MIDNEEILKLGLIPGIVFAIAMQIVNGTSIVQFGTDFLVLTVFFAGIIKILVVAKERLIKEKITDGAGEQ